jgi:hypothetical protein
MADVAHDSLQVEIFVPDEELAKEFKDELTRQGVQAVEHRKASPDEAEDRFFPIVAVVIGAVIGVHALADLILRWRDKHHCRTLIDARKAKVKQELDCRIKDGRIIVIAKDNTKVEIIDVPEAFNLTEVLKAGVSSTGEAVKAAADAAGATARDPEPATASS